MKLEQENMEPNKNSHSKIEKGTTPSLAQLNNILFDIFSSVSASQDPSNDEFILPIRHKQEIFQASLWLQLYFYLLSDFNLKFEEEDMLNPKLVRSLILDLVSHHGFTLEGFAYDAGIHLDVIEEIAYGVNTNPSSIAFARILWTYILNKPSDLTEKIRGMIQQLEYGGINSKYK